MLTLWLCAAQSAIYEPPENLKFWVGAAAAVTLLTYWCYARTSRRIRFVLSHGCRYLGLVKRNVEGDDFSQITICYTVSGKAHEKHISYVTPTKLRLSWRWLYHGFRARLPRDDRVWLASFQPGATIELTVDDRHPERALIPRLYQPAVLNTRQKLAVAVGVVAALSWTAGRHWLESQEFPTIDEPQLPIRPATPFGGDVPYGTPLVTTDPPAATPSSDGTPVTEP